MSKNIFLTLLFVCLLSVGAIGGGFAEWGGGGGGGASDVTDLTATNWRVFYSGADGKVHELVMGADGSFFKSLGPDQIPTWGTPPGGGDVLKSGTMSANWLTFWTGDGTVSGNSNFTVSGSNLIVVGALTSGGLVIGAADISEAELEILDGATLSTTELNYVDGVTSDIQTQLNAKLEAGDAVTDLDGTAYRLLYVDASGNVAELIFGASGTALVSNGPSAIPSFQTVGDVLGPGTNTDGYIPLWSGTDSKTLANGIANNSTNWNTAYTHSQIVTGNPHSLDAADVGAEPSFGVLPIADGGTNSSAAISDGRVVITASGGITQSPSITTTELGLLDGKTSLVETESDPVYIADPAFGITSGNITDWGTAYSHSQITTGNPHSLDATDVGAEPSFGTLPIADGGTNSNSALSNNLVIVSVAGALVENANDVSITELALLNGLTSIVETEVDGDASNEIQDVSYTASTRAVAMSGGGSGFTFPLFATASTDAGLVPGSNSLGTTYFLRADGTWAVPAGGAQNLGYTASTGTVTIDGGGSDATIGGFSTSSTDYGLVIGSNSVGATYYLDGSGAWSVPSGSTDDQNLSWDAANGHVEIESGTDADIGSFSTSGTNYGFVVGSNSVVGAYLNSDGSWDDLDTDISNNTDVAANTSARHTSGSDDQSLGFTPSTGTVTIDGGGSDATIGSFSTSSTDYGFTPGSNSVGATYYLDGSGAWSIPAGGTDDQNLTWDAVNGHIEIESGTDADVGGFSTTGTNYGFVIGSNGVGTTYFLRADGTWAVPAGGGDVSAGTGAAQYRLAIWEDGSTIGGFAGLTYDDTYMYLGDTKGIATTANSADYYDMLAYDEDGAAYTVLQRFVNSNDPATYFYTTGGEDYWKFCNVNIPSTDSDGGLAYHDVTDDIWGGMFTEVDGQILSYGINVIQVDSMNAANTAFPGAIFRLDARTGTFPNGHAFIVKYHSTSESTERNAFAYDLNAHRFIIWDDAGVETSAYWDFIFNGTTSSLALNSGGVDPAGILDLYGELRFSADDVFASDVAQVMTDATNGLEISGHAGTTYDLVLKEAGGNILLSNAIGTDYINIAASSTIGGNAIAYSGGAFHNGFSDYVAAEHYDWSSDNSGTAVIDGNNIEYVDPVLATGFLKVTTGTGALSSVANITLTTDVTGVLPIANGGTNSSTALNNGYVMVSSGGAVVEHASVSVTELALLDGITASLLYSGSSWTGLDGTAWSMAYTNGSGDVTELTVGANGYFLRGNGTTSAPTWDQITFTKSFTLEDPTSSEDMSIWRVTQNITIVEVNCTVVGTTPSVTINPKHASDRSAAGTALLSSATAITNTTTGQALTSFTDATLSDGEILWLETTAQSGTVDELHVTIEYTID